MTRLSELTRSVRHAQFVDRPNRFVVRCDLARGDRVLAHLPNPGRLWELLYPGVRLWLSEHGGGRSPHGASARGSARATQHTVIAVERAGEPVFLHTQASNEVAKLLIERGLIPSLADAEVAGTEVPHGHHRFDLLLRRRGREVFAEVKSVTLFGNGVAMFPDAPTTRGRRHLVALARTSRPGSRPVVLFLVHTRRAKSFLPDYHTDLDFSRTLLTLRRRLDVTAAAVGWRPRLGMPRRVEELDIDWAHLSREAHDRGAYLLVLRLDRRRKVSVGRLGRHTFEPGYWIYVGSAMQHLTARIERHRRHRKRLHWHVDYLRAVASDVRALPIRASRRLECTLARELAAVMRPGPAGFGASDCDCAAHLFHCPDLPLDSPAFHQLLQRYRMAKPDP